jgi:exopolysaccharide biosynthesis polyprenyl glycosylphosphotransferase
MPLTLAFLEGALIFLAACALPLAIPGAPVTMTETGLLLARALVLSSCALFAFHFIDLYDLRQVRRFGHFLGRLPKALVLMMLMVGALQAFVPGLGFGGRTVALSLGAAILLILPIRATLHHIISAHPFSRRVLVLGTGELAGKIVREMLAEPDLRDVVIGVVDDGSTAFKPALPSLRLGVIDNVAEIIQGFDPDLIVCAVAERHDALLSRELLRPRARNIPIEDGIACYERLTGKVAIESAAPRSILFSREQETSRTTLFFARAVSVVAASLGLIILAPLLLPIAILIKLDSDGPVFFLHERIGLGGRPFNLIKFRTMRQGDALSEWAADNAHRTTRVGYWLRRFRIDELPQFINILRGDMNLVGPRPHPVSNFQLFTENIPYYGVRCSVRPGVTGWAQIRYGYANNLKEETEKMRYDLHYIKEMSLGLDLRILFETVKVVVTGGRGAALTDEPFSRLSPIYFGIDHPRNARNATFQAPYFHKARLPRLGAGPASADSPSASVEERNAAEPTQAVWRGQA